MSFPAPTDNMKGDTYPIDLESEQSLLAAIMIFRDSAWAEAESHKITPESFFRLDHKLIFKAMTKLKRAGATFDQMALESALGQDIEKMAEGRAYLSHLDGLPMSLGSAGYYAANVKAAELKRNGLSWAGEMARLCSSPNGTGVEQIRQLANELLADLDSTAPAKRETFPPLTVTEFLQRKDKIWLFKYLLGQGDIAMIYGAPGSGKTFIVLDLLFCAALGLLFADKFSIERPLKVAYTAGEGLGGLRGRFAAAANHYQAYSNPLLANLSIFLDVPQLFDEQQDNSITRFVREWQDRQAGPLDLLIIDTLNASTVGGDENSARDMGIVMQAVKYARDSLGCAVLMVHHSGKTGSYRGSSVFHSSTDLMIETKYDDETNTGVMECFKQKDPQKFPKRPFRLAGDSVSQSAFVEWGNIITFEDGQPTKPPATERARLAILALLKEKSDLNQSGIVNELKQEASDIGRNNILAALVKLESEGAIIVAPGKRGAKVYQLQMEIDF